MNIDFNRVLQVGIALSTEKDQNKLLELIITEAMEIAHADAGTLYVHKDEALYFKIMRNHTLNIYYGGRGEDIEMPPVPMGLENVCSYTALKRKTVNIADVYHCDEFDFSGPKRYDNMTGYRTKSMMVVPFENTIGDVIGVLQLMNACDENNRVVEFSGSIMTIITALASQAAIAITNSIYLKEIEDLFQSFVEVMSTAIDEISPYNVFHTKNVAQYTQTFLLYLNNQYIQGCFEEYFDEKRQKQLIMSAWLHDVGKLITPTEILNKSTRLATNYPIVVERFHMIKAVTRIGFLENRITQSEYDERYKLVDEALVLIDRINYSGFIDDQDLAEIEKIAAYTFISLDGVETTWLTSLELEQLSIRYGTLTADERLIIENHVTLTTKLLSKIRFIKSLANVPVWAGMHHECLDGSGYPHQLTAEQIPMDARILAIVDIYDALISMDRPYKTPMSSEKAIEILREMVVAGKLDGDLVELLNDCIHAEDGIAPVTGAQTIW